MVHNVNNILGICW